MVFLLYASYTFLAWLSISFAGGFAFFCCESAIVIYMYLIMMGTYMANSGQVRNFILQSRELLKLIVLMCFKIEVNQNQLQG